MATDTMQLSEEQLAYAKLFNAYKCGELPLPRPGVHWGSNGVMSAA
jgi:hypothetical protein